METKFYLVADPHYFAHKLGCWGEEYENRMKFEQKCFAEDQAINEAVFDWLAVDVALYQFVVGFDMDNVAVVGFGVVFEIFEEKVGDSSVFEV